MSFAGVENFMKKYDYFYDFGEGNNLFTNRYVIFRNVTSHSAFYFNRAILTIRMRGDEFIVLKDIFSSYGSYQQLSESDKEELLVKILSATVL